MLRSFSLEVEFVGMQGMTPEKASKSEPRHRLRVRSVGKRSNLHVHAPRGAHRKLL
jgi:hypothetical protein